MDADQFFANSWPALAPRLRAVLARAGAPAADRDDLVQEAAIRLIGMWDSIDWDRPVEPLARRIALNAWRDQWRRRGERELLGLVPETVGDADTERAALARVEVREVSAALASLPLTTATVLRMAAADSESGRRSAVSAAVRMARSRARRALLACVQVASAALLATLAGVRWLGRTASPAAALTAAAAMAFLLAAVAPGLAGAPDVRGESGSAQLAAATPREPTAARAGSGAARTPATRHTRHRRAAAEEQPQYTVDAAGNRVGAYVDADVSGYGVQVRRAPQGQGSPVCTYGDTPNAPLVWHCDGKP